MPILLIRVDNEAHDDFMESWKNWVVDFTLMDVWQWLPFFVVLEIMGSSNTMNGLCVLRIGVQEKGDFFFYGFLTKHTKLVLGLGCLAG